MRARQAARRAGRSRTTTTSSNRVLRALPRFPHALHEPRTTASRRKLEQAQEDKVDLVCRKLRLQPGETMLDIGCGWEGLSIWAAQHYGVKAHGVTLSRAQAEWRRRGSARGPRGRCLVEHRDLRDIPEGARYDKIAAIGVIEHVGIANYPAFFGRVPTCSTTAGCTESRNPPRVSLEAHEPDGFPLPVRVPQRGPFRVTETMTEMERAGWEIVDVENLRLHYARTCRHWVNGSRPPPTRRAPSWASRSIARGACT